MTTTLKRYTEVFWAPFLYDATVDVASQIQYAKPKPFFPMLLDQRKGMEYLKCPALADTFKNDFVVCAPYDLQLTFDPIAKMVNTDRYGQLFVDRHVRSRWQISPEGMPPLVSLPPKYIMYSFDDVFVESTDLPIITSTFSSNVKIINGEFNISKWYRPLEVSFEVVDITKPVVLEAEQPMFLLRLRTPNNVPVKLTRVEVTPELTQRIHACTDFKEKRPNTKLEKLYELASEYIKMFKNQKDPRA